MVIWSTVKAMVYYRRKEALEVGGRASEFKEMCCIMSTNEILKTGKSKCSANYYTNAVTKN